MPYWRLFLWDVSTILRAVRRSFFVRYSNIRASTRHTLNTSWRGWGRGDCGGGSERVHKKIRSYKRALKKQFLHAIWPLKWGHLTNMDTFSFPKNSSCMQIWPLKWRYLTNMDTFSFPKNSSCLQFNPGHLTNMDTLFCPIGVCIIEGSTVLLSKLNAMQQININNLNHT